MKLYETLEKQLIKEPNYVTDSGELKKWVVISKAQSYDAELIGLLLEDRELKAKFFLDIKGILVFNQSLFVQFLEQKNYLNDSYTAYKNKVGLNINGKYLKQRNEVALVWAFKDCVLEGGQSREEDKREEIFFNQTLAQDEITQLLEPKVLTNAKRYTANGEKPLDQFNRNEKGIITDNLILKGNNLLGLHTLKEEFAGQVKLIYIDPPYNTGSDSFAYNDSFNHSTWLTFMKNRLEIARELLSDEGVIFVQCDDREESYLKILMDEIYSRECFISKITWQRTPEGRTALGQGTTFINNSSEYIICFCKDSSKKPTESKILKSIDATEKALEQYSYKLSNEGTRVLENTIKDSRGNEIKLYKHSKYVFEKIKSNVSNEDRLKDFEYLVRPAAQQKESSLQQKILSSIDKEILYSVEYVPSSGKSKGDLKKSFYIKDNILLFLKDYSSTDGIRVLRNAAMNDFWSHDEIQITGISEEGGVILKRGKKPEKLIRRIIEMTTVEGDLIVDYHLGSGTTAAVSHKLKRKYIGLEQLDYGDNDSVKRLKNVIAGDTSGISKDVNWKGGGEFVYLELKKYNQTFVDQIESAKDTKSVLKIWEEMKAKSFLNYNVDLQKQEAHIEDFKTLTLEEQKQHLVELLDKNQLYVNLSSLNDKDFAVSAEEKKVTKDFYQLKK